MSQSGAMFSCESCGRSFRWTPELSGKHLKCKCGSALTVPIDEPKGERPVSNVIANAAGATPNALDNATNNAASDVSTADKDKEKETFNLLSRGGVGVALFFLLLIAFTTYCYVYKFTATSTLITTVEQADAMSDGDYVQLEFPLSDNARIVETEIGSHRYALISFIGPEGIALCIEDPSDAPFSDLPVSIVGRVNTKDRKGNWPVYDRRLDFGFTKRKKLITLELTPAPNDWFLILSVAGLLYLTAFVKVLIWGPDKEDADGEAEDAAATEEA